MDKLVGLVEVTASCVWKIPADAYGGNRYESKEYFQAAKGQCYPGDFEEATASLQDMCETVVRRSVVKAIAEFRNGGEPTIQLREPTSASTPAPAPAPTQAEPPQSNKHYQVGEKPAPAPVTPDTTTPPTAAPTKKPQTVIAERLQALGVTPDELKKVVRVMFGVLAEGQRYTQQQYVDAFTEAEKVIKEIGLENFRGGLANAEKPAPAPTAPAAESVVFSTDPAVVEARKQVSAKWPMWQTELVNVASLWCADQVKDVGALDAFLISAEVTSTTPPGRIEALLSLCRHIAIGSVPQLIAYAKSSKKPMSMIESEVSSIVGKQIRFALDLHNDAVALALGKVYGTIK